MLRKIALTVLTAGLLLAPGKAQAQFMFGPWGGWGGNIFGRPMGFGGMGGSNLRYTNPMYPYNMGMGMFGGYGGMMNPYAYNPFMYNPSIFNQQLLFPGPTSSGYAPRMRDTMSPALPVPSSQVDLTNKSGVSPAAYAPSSYPDFRAHIKVLVPNSNAEVFLQGDSTNQTGTDRRFITPPLDPKSSYSYDVTVRWRDSAGEHRETRKVNLRAGATQVVDFNQ